MTFKYRQDLTEEELKQLSKDEATILALSNRLPLCFGEKDISLIMHLLDEAKKAAFRIYMASE